MNEIYAWDEESPQCAVRNQWAYGSNFSGIDIITDSH